MRLMNARSVVRVYCCSFNLEKIKKKYDKIGIYYDASALAYQIMSVLNLDYRLCELTNAIGPHTNQKPN